MSMRVGTDLVEVDSVRASLERHGERYLRRIYTAREVADCTAEPGTGPAPERLAARFAAKEATLKVLRPAGTGVAWPAIEVRRDPAGWVELALRGVAADLARAASLNGFAVSIAHEGAYATAVVIAQSRELT